MRVCCFKLKTTLEDAKQRYIKWLNLEEEYQWDETLECSSMGSVYVDVRGDNVLFEDMAGEKFFGIKTTFWLELAQENELVYAYYDEIGNAECIRVDKGCCIQEFRIYDDEIDTDLGGEDLEKAFQDWTSVADFLEQNLH